jgi:glycosyltransferase involved in cell wall biosynthesis
MKIGIDARFWRESGVGRYIRNLVFHIPQFDTGNDYVLFLRPEDIPSVAKKVGKFYRIVPVSVPWHTLSEQIKFPRILAKERIDLMHFPYFSLPIFYKGAYIVTIHDLILHHYPTGQASTQPFFIYQGKLLGYKFIMQQSARKAVNIVTVSESTKDEIIDHLHVRSGKVHVVYEGIDANFAEKSLLRPIIAGNYFLHVGNVYPHKNMEKLLRAFQLFLKTREHGKLVLVGKEDYFFTRLIKRIREMNLGSNIVFLGEVSDQDLTNLYTGADALVASSLMEGFDLPSIEALYHNCLVVASDISVHREILQKAAIYFDPYDVQDMAAKLLSVYSFDKEKIKAKKKVGKSIAAAFSWEKMTQQTIQIYESSTRL